VSETYISASLRREIIERAGNCCEYCKLSQDDNFFTFHIDHIISTKHNGKTETDNLCLSCPNCNLAKGSDIAGADPESGKATFLYNPRKQRWLDHFELGNDKIVGNTPEGQLTVQLLQFNNKERVVERTSLIKLGRYPC